MQSSAIDSNRPQRRREAAEFLTEQGFPIAPTTLAKYACVGGGPPYRLWSRKALYDPSELLEWARARCSSSRRSTSEADDARRGGL
jgi:hypothetical protein